MALNDVTNGGECAAAGPSTPRFTGRTKAGGRHTERQQAGNSAGKRASPVAWTHDEHSAFLAGVERFGRGRWAAISKTLQTRTPAQVASHAQKYYQRMERRLSDGSDAQMRCSVSLDSDSEPRSGGVDSELCSAWVLPQDAAAALDSKHSSLAQLLARSYSQMLAQALAQNGWAMPDAEEAGALRVLATHLMRNH